MRTPVRLTIVALALSIAAFAAPAAALIPCEDCAPDMPGSTRCIAVCNGQIIRTCAAWFASSCANLVPREPRTAEEAEERFIRTLQEEAERQR